MKVIFELSGEHPSLSIYEILHSLSSEDIDYGYYDVFGSFLLVDLKSNKYKIEMISKKLALSHFIDSFIFSTESSKEYFLKRAEEKEIKIDGSFRVRCENRSGLRVDSVGLEKDFGKILAKRYKVNLTNPNTEIRLLLSKEIWLVGIKLFKIDRRGFEHRKANLRPFFLPISMHPRLARCMVNLSEVRVGERLLDPFCGTGGILIEAGLTGVKILGSDVQKWIAEGCKKNLEHYNIKEYEVENMDVGDIGSFGKVDAVVTDFPYGRASTTKKEPVEELYSRAFLSISDVLRDGKKLVCAIPEVELLKIGCEYLDLTEVHPFTVHGNLTRYICVFTK